MSDTTFERLAERTLQKGVIVGWPGLEGILKDYPERLARATKEVSNIAVAIAQFEPVTVVVGAERVKEAEEYFAEVNTPFSIKVHEIEGNSMDVWLRDFGPVFVVKNGPGADRSLVGLDYNFNGWGGRYPTDTTVGFAKRLLEDLDYERIETSIVTEGGALETDGDGTLLVTESSIVNENRNPGKSRQEIEDELIRTLGVKKVIWIPGRPKLDSTDCHVDALVRFVEPGVVLLSKANEEEPTDWTVVYEETLNILRSSLDARGLPFEIIEVEEPDEDLFEEGGFKGDRAVRSYVNYLIVNRGVILPQFGDGAHDLAARRLAQNVFGQHWKIAPVFIEELPTLGGGIHCTTQEIPFAP
ncbi:porphyromonas-type peptidyl-arginine deiminase [Trichoderma longibrachiatum]|uniref:Porphyromonas-type peptidyl-arginine deiminase n=1 Tax=Trichoderma longibrachiatum ATCC 18648 TaxID=983965 RepID=A0A2T4C901_TRILO|nr:porphyromonas-type peptidyl-arginine deiminase [Trichoderma longibrachiatum ATCC 18648]